MAQSECRRCPLWHTRSITKRIHATHEAHHTSAGHNLRRWAQGCSAHTRTLLPCPALCQGLVLWAQRAPCCPAGYAGSGCSAALRCAVREEVSAGIRVASRKGLIQSPRRWADRSSSPLVPPFWQHKQNLTVS